MDRETPVTSRWQMARIVLDGFSRSIGEGADSASTEENDAAAMAFLYASIHTTEVVVVVSKGGEVRNWHASICTHEDQLCNAITVNTVAIVPVYLEAGRTAVQEIAAVRGLAVLPSDRTARDAEVIAAFLTTWQIWPKFFWARSAA